MSACGNNKALDALKAKQAELDSLLQGGKDELAAVQAKLDAMAADLASFKPELPKLDSLQDKLNELKTKLDDPFGLVTLQAEIKEKFGDAVGDLDDLISGALLGDDACVKAPNVEAAEDGTVKEQPVEPKVPEEPPKPEEPTPLSDKDIEDANKRTMFAAYKLAYKSLFRQAKTELGGLFNSKKAGIAIMKFAHPEMYIFVAEVSGTTFDDLKKFDYSLEDLRKYQAAAAKKYPGGEAYFAKFVPEVKAKFIELNTEFPAVYGGTTIEEAAQQYTERRMAKLAREEAEEV